MTKFKIFLINLILLFFTSYSQKTFLFSSSIGYYNYRQNSNILQIYKILSQHGYDDKNTWLAFPQNVGCCQKNIMQGIISFKDGQYININKNIKTLHKYHQISAQKISKRMIFKYNKNTLNFKKLPFNQQPYFIYTTGHGGDGYFKIKQRQALITQNYQHMFIDLEQRLPKLNVLLLSDSCGAVTPFQHIKTKNFVGIGSSSEGQKSTSHGFQLLLNAAKSDDFTYYFNEFINSQYKKGQKTIKQLANYMDFTKLHVHSKLISPNSKKSKSYLSQYINRKMKIKQHKIDLQLPIDMYT